MIKRDERISVDLFRSWPVAGLLGLLLLISVAALGPGCACDSGIAHAPEAAEAARASARLDHALSRVVVIGASLSAGFGLFVAGRPPVTLADLLDAALDRPHGPIKNLSDLFFFRDPHGAAHAMLAQAGRVKPTLVVALDFLFWFSYGAVADESQRRLHLADGLALLARFDCPVIVGDLPDMSDAVGRMLRRDQVPSPAMLETLNADIQAWCERHDNRSLVSLSGFMAQVRRDGFVSLGSRRFQAPDADGLLQIDKLHPTLLGAAGTGILALAVFQDALGPQCPDFFCKDPEMAVARIRKQARNQKDGKHDPS